MPYLKTLFFCAALSLSVLTLHAFADTCGVAGNLVQNCGFDTGDFTGWMLSGNIADPSTAWTYVDPVAPHSGTYAAEMGPVGSPEMLSQTFVDTAGSTGILTFWLENEATRDLDGNQYTGFSQFAADVDGQQLVFLANPVAQTGSYTLYQASFVMTGTDTLSFNMQNDPGYFDLDDISVVAAAPEPSGLMLLGTGLSAIAGAVRRRANRG